VSKSTVFIDITLRGAKTAAKDLKLLNKELAKLDKTKIKFLVHIQDKNQQRKRQAGGLATKPLIRKSELQLALMPAMKLNPSMLSPFINNGLILPDKFAMFYAAIQKLFMKVLSGYVPDSKDRVIRNRDQFFRTYSDDIDYFRSKSGSGINKVLTSSLRRPR